MKYKVSLDLYNKLYQKYNLGTIKSKLDETDITDILNLQRVQLNCTIKCKQKIRPENDEHIVCLSDEFYNFMKKNDHNINKIISYNKLYRIINNITNNYNFYSFTNSFYIKINKYNMIYYKFKQMINANYIRKRVLIVNFISEYTYDNQRDDIRIYI